MERDSSPDMVTYDTTTPAKPIAMKTTSSHRPRGRTAAGPSNRSASTATKRSKAKKSTPDSSGVESDHPIHIEIPSSGEDEAPPPVIKPRSKKPAASDAFAPSNGKVPFKGKGKAKEDPQSEHQSKDDLENLMNLDEIQDLTNLPEDDLSGPPAPTSKPNGIPKLTIRDADFKRAQKQLQQREKEVQSLKSQIELLIQQRTDQEHAHEDWKKQYETSNETYKAYNREQQQIERSVSSHISLTPHFLSREEADEEKRSAEKAINTLRQTVQARNSVIVQKEKRITDLEDIVRTLNSDLNAEIERGKLLAARPPGHSRAFSEVQGVDTHKKAAATRLYEDLTNVLVLSVKTEKSESPDKEDTVYQCLYTHPAESETRSISFQLRLYFEPKDDEWKENVKYTPHELDKESDGFRKHLAFLGDTFTFEKHQMQVFYEQLREHVAGAVEQEAKDVQDVIDLRSDVDHDDHDDLYA